jgi:hypothetical protein
VKTVRSGHTDAGVIAQKCELPFKAFVDDQVFELSKVEMDDCFEQQTSFLASTTVRISQPLVTLSPVPNMHLFRPHIFSTKKTYFLCVVKTHLCCKRPINEFLMRGWGLLPCREGEGDKTSFFNDSVSCYGTYMAVRRHHVDVHVTDGLNVDHGGQGPML